MAFNFEGFEYKPVGKTPAQQNETNREHYGQQPGVYTTGSLSHDAFSEGEHTRAANGQFGSGGGAGKEDDLVTVVKGEKGKEYTIPKPNAEQQAKVDAMKAKIKAKAAATNDTDMELLRQELDEFLTEEGQEPEHQDTNLIAAQ